MWRKGTWGEGHVCVSVCAGGDSYVYLCIGLCVVYVPVGEGPTCV